MISILHFFFGRGWYVFLYLLFYITIALPSFLAISEIDYILTNAEFTGPGFGMWLLMYLFSAYWSLLFLVLVISSLKIKIGIIIKLIMAAFLISGFLMAGGFLSFLEIAAVNLSLMITNFYLIFRFQNRPKTGLSQEQKNKISKQTILILIVSFVVSTIGVLILAYIWLPNGFSDLEMVF